MATTVQQVFNITMDLIDERLDTGIINPTDTLSYSVKTPGLLTLLQTELIKQGDLFSTYEISNKPIESMLGYMSEFDVVQFLGTELSYECEGSVKAYYFEVDRVGTVYVEDYNGTWNTLATIVTTYTASSFTAYRGVVTPSVGATQSRLRFTGDYYYLSVNRAMFSVPFALAADVPDYKPWVKYQMPLDFKSVNEIIEEYPNQQYGQDSAYKWEGRRDLYINYFYVGKVRIVYRPAPLILTALTDSLQVDDVTARTLLPYGLAAHLMLEENSATASFFNGRYEELKRDAAKKPPSSTEMINNYYGTFG